MIRGVEVPVVSVRDRVDLLVKHHDVIIAMVNHALLSASITYLPSRALQLK
jgi:hypothetical protein